MTDTDWAIERVAKVVDGDTFDAILSRPVGEIDGFRITATSLPERPARLRLVHLDTPEEGEQGYREASGDLAGWLRMHDGHLRVVTSKKDAFGRYLADVYVDFNRYETASDFMVRDANYGEGWPVWIKGR